MREKSRASFSLRFPGAFSSVTFPNCSNIQEELMARKTILVCDNCGTEVDEGKGAMMRVNYTDARRRSKQADLCDACAGGMPGHEVARRGRRPKAAV
jgi:ribosomal protein S27E